MEVIVQVIITLELMLQIKKIPCSIAEFTFVMLCFLSLQ